MSKIPIEVADQSLKKQTVHGVLWRTIETGGNQIIQFLISIILARLILPEQFAAIAMLSIFLAVAGDFISSGFPNALIRKIDRTHADCCTVFYFNIIVSILAYIILYYLAPFVAKFYNLPELIPILRVTSLTLIIGAIGRIQYTLYNAKLDFKLITELNLIASLVSGVCGIIFAYLDFQVWALVLQSIISHILSTVLIWIKSTWRPSLVFSWESLSNFFSYGSKLLATSLLSTLYVNMYGVIIGKFFPPQDLAFYNRSVSVSNLASSTPTNVLTTVTFPVLCKLQDNIPVLRSKYRQMLSLSAFIIFPLCLGLSAVSYPLINVLYTQTWIGAAVLLQILAFSAMFRPIHAINLNLLQVVGRSDLFFRLEVIKKIIAVVLLCITLPMGLKAMCMGEVLLSIISLVINTYYTGQILNLGFFSQIKDILPSLILSLILFGVCKFISSYVGMGILSLVISTSAGIVLYFGLAFLVRLKELELLRGIVNEERSNRAHGKNN